MKDAELISIINNSSVKIDEYRKMGFRLLNNNARTVLQKKIEISGQGYRGMETMILYIDIELTHSKHLPTSIQMVKEFILQRIYEAGESAGRVRKEKEMKKKFRSFFNDMMGEG